MAIEVKTSTRNPRSTVGTSTEIYDYMRLLFARAGKTYSPVSGKEVKRDTIEDIIKYVTGLEDKTKLYILFPIHTHEAKTQKQELENLMQKGFFRIWSGKEIVDLNQGYDARKIKLTDVKAVVDRLALNKGDSEQMQRITDSLEQAYAEGDGYLFILTEDKNGFDMKGFNMHMEADGIRFEEPEPLMFSFNSPVGACPRCQGFGETIDLDMDLIVPDKNKSIFQNAIHPFSTPKHSKHLSDLIAEGKKDNIQNSRAV